MEVQDTKSTLEVAPRNEEKIKKNLEDCLYSSCHYGSGIYHGIYHGQRNFVVFLVHYIDNLEG